MPHSLQHFAIFRLAVCSVAIHLAVSSGEESALQRARTLIVPDVLNTTQGETEHFEFWASHAELLREAWQEWGSSNILLPTLNVTEIVEPTKLSSWREIAPDVYHCDRFLSIEGTARLKRFIDAAIDTSGIPRRRPNGMNRFGGVFHPVDGVDGSVALEAWGDFYKDFMQYHILPLGRRLFSAYIRSDLDDAESYAFTIRYKAGKDLQLKEHTDASLYTININLNEEESNYGGSSVYFVSEKEDSSTNTTIEFAPGSAVIHRGQIRHGSTPLTQGERQNLVIWVFGQHGYVRIKPYKDDDAGAALWSWGANGEL